MSSKLVVARAVSRSYMRWSLSQNSGVVPRALAIRRAESAVMARRLGRLGIVGVGVGRATDCGETIDVACGGGAGGD